MTLLEEAERWLSLEYSEYSLYSFIAETLLTLRQIETSRFVRSYYIEYD